MRTLFQKEGIYLVLKNSFQNIKTYGSKYLLPL